MSPSLRSETFYNIGSTCNPSLTSTSLLQIFVWLSWHRRKSHFFTAKTVIFPKRCLCRLYDPRSPTALFLLRISLSFPMFFFLLWIWDSEHCRLLPLTLLVFFSSLGEIRTQFKLYSLPEEAVFFTVSKDIAELWTRVVNPEWFIPNPATTFRISGCDPIFWTCLEKINQLKEQSIEISVKLK